VAFGRNGIASWRALHWQSAIGVGGGAGGKICTAGTCGGVVFQNEFSSSFALD